MSSCDKELSSVVLHGRLVVVRLDFKGVVSQMSVIPYGNVDGIEPSTVCFVDRCSTN